MSYFDAINQRLEAISEKLEAVLNRLAQLSQQIEKPVVEKMSYQEFEQWCQERGL